jgi:hypothetical protein
MSCYQSAPVILRRKEDIHASYKIPYSNGLDAFPPDEATVSDKADAACPALSSTVKQIVVNLLRDILRVVD